MALSFYTINIMLFGNNEETFVAIANELEIFYQVVQCGSFSAAAEKLKVSKSYISKHINHLEQSLHCQLLYRSTRAMNITQAGEQLLPYATQCALASERALEVTQDSSTQLSGSIKISVMSAWGNKIFVPLLQIDLVP